ncbi:uncharacterized protein F4812DRAFT_454795 [Daldinia caldariorum]|uniref:uncharacterized protein n=1 Tax=Daldinia caldariorum TaxID=326644 RepID=UPI0020083E9E|nr:uncharacterized protein F4812DRAFT_454795 [Daldinia caldariorum]KAI1472976.1 hypothetical protein F4812DRAFT_454795 [Daldinia caldariorum]
MADSTVPRGARAYFESWKEFIRDQEDLNSKDVIIGVVQSWIYALYDTRYFVPQWDEQLLGPAWRQRRQKWDFENPPKPWPLTDPKMKDAFKHCDKCQLTWLVGYSKLEHHDHPQHLAWKIPEDDTNANRAGLITGCSLVIHIHGDALPKGQASKSPTGSTASLGVFFGPDSKFNIAGPCSEAQYDAEIAELAAVMSALVIVQVMVVDEHKELLSETVKGKSEETTTIEEHLASLDFELMQRSSAQTSGSAPPPPQNAGGSNSSSGSSSAALPYKTDKLPFRIILVSDNAQVVDNICKYRKQWREEGGKLLTKHRKPVKNGRYYQDIERVLTAIEARCAFVVKFYCVSKERNKGAAELAKDALQGKFCGNVRKAVELSKLKAKAEEQSSASAQEEVL